MRCKTGLKGVLTTRALRLGVVWVFYAEERYSQGKQVSQPMGMIGHGKRVCSSVMLRWAIKHLDSCFSQLCIVFGIGLGCACFLCAIRSRRRWRRRI